MIYKVKYGDSKSVYIKEEDIDVIETIEHGSGYDYGVEIKFNKRLIDGSQNVVTLTDVQKIKSV